MEDYEIRDVMNRRVHPDVILDFEIKLITQQELYWIQPTFNPLYQAPVPAQPQIVQKTILALNCMPKNIGTVVAEHVHYFIKLPSDLVAPGQQFDVVDVRDGFAKVRRENIYCDILEGSTPLNVKYGPPRIVPILPGMIGVYKGIILNSQGFLPNIWTIRFIVQRYCIMLMDWKWNSIIGITAMYYLSILHRIL